MVIFSKIHSFPFKYLVPIIAYVSSSTPRKGGSWFCKTAGSLSGITEACLKRCYAVVPRRFEGLYGVHLQEKAVQEGCYCWTFLEFH